MSETHPHRDALEAFLRAELPAADNRRIVRHLLTGCRQCRQITSRLWPAAGAGQPTRTGGAAGYPQLRFDRLVRQARAQAATAAGERDEVAELDAELSRHPAPRRLVLALNSRRFHTWSLCRHLMTRAFHLGFDAPPAALETAGLAVAIADALDAARYGASMVNDARSRAWATLGNARRINSDLAGAEEALAKAFGLLEEGTGDPLERARVLSLTGYLRHDQRRLQLAAGLFDQAAKIYRKLGDEHMVGEALADRGTSLGRAGDLDAAIACLEMSLERLDPARSPRRILAAKHNLSLYLQENGDVGQALSVLKQILPQYARQGDRMNILRLRWLEGKLAQAQHQLARAEEAFQEVQTAFVELAIPYDAALVSLDLATVYLAGRRYAEIRELAGQMLEIFRALGIDREALAALAIFCRAAELETVTRRFITELAAHLENAKTRPGLHFKPS